jgi:hypothetical protein
MGYIECEKYVLHVQWCHLIQSRPVAVEVRPRIGYKKKKRKVDMRLLLLLIVIGIFCRTTTKARG